MKLCVTMQKDREYNLYTSKGPNDWRFYPLLKILSDDFHAGQLINWLMDENKESIGSEWVSIDKEGEMIALYDVSASMYETYCGAFIDPTKRFVLTVDNFRELLEKWEELQRSKPDIILIVIHEDDHVSLEANANIIQEYQEAGYAFEIDKNPQKIQEFVFLQKTAQGSLDSMFSNITSLLYLLPDVFLELNIMKVNLYYPVNTVIVTRLYFNTFIYYNIEKNTVYIGSFGAMDHEKAQHILHPDNILQYIDCHNSFSMQYQDFMQLKQVWDTIQQVGYPYFMMYRDNKEAIFCKGFDSTDAMIHFVKESMPDKGKMVGNFSL